MFVRYDAGVADISAGARLTEPEAPLWKDPVTGARLRREFYSNNNTGNTNHDNNDNYSRYYWTVRTRV